MSRSIVTADIGGTHARFALAAIDGSRVAEISEPVTFRTADFEGVEAAWEEFGRRAGEPLPRELTIAFAGSVGVETLKLTNSSWQFTRDGLREALRLDRLLVMNDFAAVAHAVAQFGGDRFRHICGPEKPLPTEGVISIVGPGTGLGIAAVLRRAAGSYEVIGTEGGHMDFAPIDEVEDAILKALRSEYDRVSVERLLSGRGLMNIYQALASIEGRPAPLQDEKQLWSEAMHGSDALAERALERFCLTLGAFAGDLALAQGARAAVIAGGLGLRLAGHLPGSGFGKRFTAKGRYERHMEAMPVKLITDPQPGLYGAAAAFARDSAQA